MKIGAVPVPVSDALPAEELAFLLQDSRARAVIASEAAAAEILEVRAQCPALQSVIVVGGRRRGALEYERLLEKASPELAPADTSRDDVALWLYTSGSTGRPKAAVHLHHDLVHAAELVGRGTFGIGPTTSIFSASKLHFAFGLGNSLYFPALVGAASVLVPERLEAERIFELIQAERPTVLFAVATVYRRLLQVEGAERRFDLLLAAALRLLGRGAARRALPRLEVALRPRAARRGGLDRGAARLHRQPAGRGAAGLERAGDPRLRGAAGGRPGPAGGARAAWASS